MSLSIEIQRVDLPEEIHEEARARGDDALDVFAERLNVVSEWSPEVDNSDHAEAITYSVNEVFRTVDNVTGDNGNIEATDSGFDTTERGRIDLRDETK